MLSAEGESMKRRTLVCLRLELTGILVLALAGIGGAFAQNSNTNNNAHGNVYGKMRSTTQAQREAAAENARKAGLKIGNVGATANLLKSSSGTQTPLGPSGLIPPPGGTPDYFGPYSNYANSPLPGGDSESRMKEVATDSTSAKEKKKMATDPVCNMDVDPQSPGVVKTQYKGVVYYFCSKLCKKSFDAAPDKYARKSTAKKISPD